MPGLLIEEERSIVDLGIEVKMKNFKSAETNKGVISPL